MLHVISWLIGRLSPSWLGRIGGWLGVLVFSLLRIRRKVTLENLHRALGLPRAACLELARKVYTHLCIGALEFMRIGTLNRARAEEILGQEGLELLRGVLAQGRGMLVLGAHIGHWDLLACAAALCGLKVNVVTREIKSSWLNRYWMAQRARCGVKLLPARGSALSIRRALKRNEVVAMVLDQHEPGGLVVPFFGRPAATGAALARLARATGSPVVPVFLLRDGAGYQLQVDRPLMVHKTADRHGDVTESTRRLNLIIEQQVRAHPEQWLWLHRRWKVGVAGETVDLKNKIRATSDGGMIGPPPSTSSGG